MAIVILMLLEAIAILLLIAARKPDTFTVMRRARFAAPPEALFAQLNDLKAWQAWSLWAKKDPAARSSFGPVTAGMGAFFAWHGNSRIGKGSMTITESRPAVRVGLRLDFEQPFKASNSALFTLTPVEGGTEVTWEMSGRASLMSKVMDCLMNMDKMVGTDFEQGLANLGAIVEAR